MSVFAPILGFFWKCASDCGLDPDALFREAGIDPTLRRDINARITEKQFDELVWKACQQGRGEETVIRLVTHMHPSYLGALGYAWLTSATLRKAFQRAERYFAQVSTNTQVRVEESGDELLVHFDTSATGFHDLALRERVRLLSPVQLSRLCYGENFAPSRILFAHPEPPDAAPWYAFFRCEIHWEQATNALVLPLQVADEPLTGFNPQLVQHFDQLIADYLARHDRKDIVGRTRAAILEELPSGNATLETIAERLLVSPRTLARKLADRDESYKTMLAGIRRELSEKYILDQGLSLTEISFLLGFSEASSFSRAYRGWTGRSPSTHRSELFENQAAD